MIGLVVNRISMGLATRLVREGIHVHGFPRAPAGNRPARQASEQLLWLQADLSAVLDADLQGCLVVVLDVGRAAALPSKNVTGVRNEFVQLFLEPALVGFARAKGIRVDRARQADRIPDVTRELARPRALQLVL